MCSVAAVSLLDAVAVSSSSPRSIIVRRRRSLTALGRDLTRVDLSVSRRSRTSSPTDGGTAATPSLPARDSVVSSSSWRMSSGTSRMRLRSRDRTYRNILATEITNTPCPHKKVPLIFFAVTFTNIDRFSQFFVHYFAREWQSHIFVMWHFRYIGLPCESVRHKSNTFHTILALCTCLYRSETSIDETNKTQQKV